MAAKRLSVLTSVLFAVIKSASCHQLFCPNKNDLIVAYTVPGSINELIDGGWTSKGGGAAATRSSFNLLGGYVEYDIDLSNVRTKVNANVYTVSPKFDGPFFQKSAYCDGAATGNKWCLEVDWLESNGNCGGATTLHTVQGPGNDGCTAWGCRSSYHYNGRSKFHMRVDYQADGTWTTTRDGMVIDPSELQPTPRPQDWAILKQQYEERGAVIYSSIWTGWVPVADCGSGGGGDLANSAFTVSNLTISGTVVQGPQPTVCGGPPSPPPPPPPCVDPNDGKTSDGTLCSKQKEYGNCGASWMHGWCCKTCFNCSGSDRCGGVATFNATSIEH